MKRTHHNDVILYLWVCPFLKKILDMFVVSKNNYYLCHRKIA